MQRVSQYSLRTSCALFALSTSASSNFVAISWAAHAFIVFSSPTTSFSVFCRLLVPIRLRSSDSYDHGVSASGIRLPQW